MNIHILTWRAGRTRRPKKKPGGRGSLPDNSDLKLHASKDGTIAAHLTQIRIVGQRTPGGNHLEQMQRRIAGNKHPVKPEKISGRTERTQKKK
jgi:hypothetical protein